MSGSVNCPHLEGFHFHINVASMGDTNLKYLEITGKCKSCDKAIAFRGPLGSSPDHPAMSPDGAEARLPFLCEGEELTGKPIGFSINLR